MVLQLAYTSFVVISKCVLSATTTVMCTGLPAGCCRQHQAQIWTSIIPYSTLIPSCLSWRVKNEDICDELQLAVDHRSIWAICLVRSLNNASLPVCPIYIILKETFSITLNSVTIRHHSKVRNYSATKANFCICGIRTFITIFSKGLQVTHFQISL
jgi:hypothetical protein